MIRVLAALLAATLLLSACTGGSSSDTAAPAVRGDVARAMGSFPDPESAALAAATEAHATVPELTAEQLLLLNDARASRVEVRGGDGFCAIYAPAQQPDGDGWYSGGSGTPCEAIETG